LPRGREALRGLRFRGENGPIPPADTILRVALMSRTHKISRAPASAVFAAAFVFACSPSGLGQDTGPSPMVVQNVTVIDVGAGQARPGQSVVIDGDTIVKTGPSAEIGTPPPSRVIDGSGLFLMPGTHRRARPLRRSGDVRTAARRERSRPRA
jgi:hypothetical protein